MTCQRHSSTQQGMHPTQQGNKGCPGKRLLKASNELADGVQLDSRRYGSLRVNHSLDETSPLTSRSARQREGSHRRAFSSLARLRSESGPGVYQPSLLSKFFAGGHDLAFILFAYGRRHSRLTSGGRPCSMDSPAPVLQRLLQFAAIYAASVRREKKRSQTQEPREHTLASGSAKLRFMSRLRALCHTHAALLRQQICRCWADQRAGR